MLKIAFVCTGNTCRSPMAQALLKHMLAKKGENLLDYNIYSLGIAAMNGDSASKGSIDAMKDMNIDISNHRSQRVNPENVQADILIAMSKSHKYFLLDNTDNKEVYMLNEFAGLGEKDVHDPYGQDEYEYIKVRDEMILSIEKILDKIIELKNKKQEVEGI